MRSALRDGSPWRRGRPPKVEPCEIPAAGEADGHRQGFQPPGVILARLVADRRYRERFQRNGWAWGSSLGAEVLERRPTW